MFTSGGGIFISGGDIFINGGGNYTNGGGNYTSDSILDLVYYALAPAGDIDFVLLDILNFCVQGLQIRAVRFDISFIISNS